MIIVLFHVLYLVGKFVYQKYHDNKRKAIADVAESSSTIEPLNISRNDYKRIDIDGLSDDEDEKPDIRFSPPAYVQRYVAVQNVLSDPKYQGKLRKVVDFGCSELGFLVYLKNIIGIEEILCVDIDRVLLDAYVEKAAPLSYEYLHCRIAPLVIGVYEGSITDRDKVLEKTDAVVCIEVIEHLYPDTLTEFPINVFGYIKPKVAIFTTPNAEFNVLFPNLTGFRHADHKFEWTREQFQDWAENIVLRYPDYTVSFCGICKGPPGTEHLGSCSQMAIFHRHEEQCAVYPIGMENLFKLVVSYDYPYRVDNRSDEEKIVDEAAYYILQLSYGQDNAREEVSLQRLLQFLTKFSITLSALRTILEEAGYDVVEGEAGPVVLVASQSSHSGLSLDEIWSDGEGTPDLGSIDNDSASNVDAWDTEPGPPDIPYEYVVPPGMNEETWDDEPSIIIPENRSISHDNTYLFSGEEDVENIESIESIDRLNPFELRAEIGLSLRPDIDSSNPDTPRSSTQMTSDDLDCSQNSTTTASILSTSNMFTCISDLSQNPENNLSSIDVMDHWNAEQNDSIELRNTSRVSRILHYRKQMSVSRASTSPPPLTESLCSNAFIYNDIAESDNSCNQSMMNNTFRHCNFFDESVGETDIDLTPVGSEEFEDCTTVFRTDKFPQSIETKDSNTFDSMAESVNAGNKCQSTDDGCLPTDQPVDCISSNTAPQYTSSPRVIVKRGAGRGILRARRRNELCTDRQNSRLSSTSQSSLQSSSNVSTTSIGSCGTVGRWYPAEKNVMYQIGSIELKGGNDMADKSSTDNASESTISLSTDELNEPTLLTNEKSTENIQVGIATVQNQQSDEKRTTSNEPQTCTRIEMDTHTLSIKDIPHTQPSVAVSHAEHIIEEEACPKFINADIKASDNTNLPIQCSAKETSDLEDSIMSKCTMPLSLNNDTSVSERTQENECALQTVSSEGWSTKRASVTETGSVKVKLPSPESLETSPNSWSPEIVDSGYPNSASAPDMTPEYDLSSIAHDHISDSESPSAEEAPRLEFLELVEVENGDLVNNNRDYEGNNIVPVAEVNDLEDLQPLIDDLENDIENENDIYALENEFPIWLLRILEIENPADLQGQGLPDHEHLQQPDIAAGGDAEFARIDEGFDSSTSEDESDTDDDYEMQNDFNNEDVHENNIDDDDTDDGDDGDDEDENEVSYEFDNMNDRGADDVNAVDDVNGSSSHSGSDPWAAGDT